MAENTGSNETNQAKGNNAPWIKNPSNPNDGSDDKVMAWIVNGKREKNRKQPDEMSQISSG